MSTYFSIDLSKNYLEHSFSKVCKLLTLNPASSAVRGCAQLKHLCSSKLCSKEKKVTLKVSRFLFSFFCSVSGVLRALSLCDPLWIKQQDTWAALQRCTPGALRWSACMDPFTNQAAAVGGLSPLKSPRQAMVTVCKVCGIGGEERRAQDQGVLQASCRGFRERSPTAVALWGGSESCSGSERGGLGSHSNPIRPQKPSCCVCLDFHIFLKKYTLLRFPHRRKNSLALSLKIRSINFIKLFALWGS